MDERRPVAEAVLLRAGRIAAAGREGEVRAAAAPGADLVDVGGRTIVPGFIDAHNHLSLALFAPLAVDCSTPPLLNLAQVLEAIEAHCRTIPPGRWVMGMGFHMSHVREQRNPTRWELDEVAPDHPFFLIDMSCHAGFANSRALAEVGISAHSPCG